MGLDWIGILTGMTSDIKFNQFSEKLNEVLDKVAPVKTVKILSKKRFVEPWITRGLDIAGRNKLKMYKKTLSSTCTPEEIQKYKDYRNHYNSLKNKLKK